jgi:hypothetical protein
MNQERFTRRVFVRRAGVVASAVTVGLALEPAQGSAALADDLLVGQFVEAQGSRAAVISDLNGDSVLVTLDPSAYVMHGADGVVDGMDAFVSGEEVVVVRGERSEQGIAVAEFQSVYTSVDGTIVADDGGIVLVTSSGRVRVPEEVVSRRMPAGIEDGVQCVATIWTNPRTGEATALEVSPRS